MPDLSFAITGLNIVPCAVTPTLGLELQIRNAIATETIHTVSLRCQIQIEANRRRYTADEQLRLVDLFGEPDRWSQTLRSLLWTHVNLMVPGFPGPTTKVEMQVPCTFDFNVAATKYFAGLNEGGVPALALFGGTVFYAPPDSPLQVAPISWDKEAKFTLPVSVWREMMDTYYPNSAWLNLRRDAFERLYQYKTRHGIPTWEQVIDEVLNKGQAPEDVEVLDRQEAARR